MKKIILILIIGLSWHCSYSQIETHLINGKRNIELKAYEDAIKDFNEVLKITPHSEEAYHYRAQAYHQLGEWLKAMNDLDKAINLSPKQLHNYIVRATVYQELGRFQDALSDYEKCLELSPYDETANFGKIQCLLAIDELYPAITLCEQLLSNAHHSSELYLNKAQIEETRGEYQDAIFFLKKAQLVSNPTDNRIALSLAIFYYKQKQLDKGLEILNQLISIDGFYAPAFLWRALIYLEKGQTNQALEDASQALLNDSRCNLAHLVRWIGFKNKQESANAQTEWNALLVGLKSIDDYYSAVWLIQRVSSNLPVLQQITPWIDKVYQVRPNYETTMLYAQLLFEQGQWTQAQQYASKAQEIGFQKGLPSASAIDLLKLIEKNYSLSADKSGPLIALTEPKVESYRGFDLVSEADKIVIAGQVSDESGIDKVLINGNPAHLENGNFRGEAILDKAENYIRIKAIDKRGNPSERELLVMKPATKSTVATNQTAKKEINGPKNRALLIACQEYEFWHDLANPVLDANSLAQELKDHYGFETEILKNPTKNDIMIALANYAQYNFQPEDQLFIFFAGHGNYDENSQQGYFITKEGLLQDKNIENYLTYPVLKRYLNNLKCGRVLAVFDACFGGTFSSEKVNETSPKSTSSVSNAKSRLFLSSGGKEKVLDGNAGNHSAFTTHLLNILGKGDINDKVLTMDELTYTLKQVHPNIQTGYFGDNEVGANFYFRKK